MSDPVDEVAYLSAYQRLKEEFSESNLRDVERLIKRAHENGFNKGVAEMQKAAKQIMEKYR